MQLILTRHAKSSWDDPYLRDHDRPLAKRGRKSSDAIGRWLVEHEYVPNIVLCSTSRRTCETWERIEAFMPEGCEVRFEPDLYHGYTNSFLETLAKADDSPVLMLGHNPGIGYFAESILREIPRHFAFLKYPTAATLVCDVPANRWTDVELGTAELVDFVVPRELV